MPLNVLQKNQSYPDLGYRIDGHGIAYDLKTGQSLSRQDVDARIAQAENVNPATNDYAERDAHRGGIAGVYDRNKKYINPAAELALGLIPGIGPALAAAYGGATGFDREGKGGIGYDAGKGALGAVSGYGLGKLGGGLGKMAGIGSGAASTAGAAGTAGSAGMKMGAFGIPVMDTASGIGGISDIANAAVHETSPSLLSKIGSVGSSLLGGGGDGKSGLTAADWLKTISGGVGAALDYKSGQSKQEEDVNRYARDTGNKEAQTAANTQQLLNRAPMADNAQALLRARMGQAPTTFAPRDYTRTGLTPQTMAAPATGGPQDALAAGRTAAANYQPGQGGVDTSVLELLKKRMMASSGMAG